MGSAPSCKEFSVRPAEELRFQQDLEQRIVQHDDWLESTLMSLVGKITWKLSSWSDLMRLLQKDQQRFVAGLRDAFDPEEAEDSEVAAISLDVIEGHYANVARPPRTGMWTFLPDGSPRIWMYLDHEGNEFGSTTSINTGAGTTPFGDTMRMGARPAVPSAEALGIKTKLDAIHTRPEEDCYVIKLSHHYSLTQFDPPIGPFEWTCEVVFLVIEMRQRRHIVLQLSASEIGQDGRATVAASSLAGEQVCAAEFHLADTDVAMLLQTTARQCGHEEHRLRLVFPSGVVADWKSGSLKLDALFNASEH